MINIVDLRKQYKGGVEALRGVTLEIGPGMFGLVGPNGAGKTTLMRILAGLLRPSAGTVNVFGHDLRTRKGKRSVKASLGYLPQELGLYPNLSAREFLDYVAILKGISVGRGQQVEALLETVALQDAADRRLRTFSGGMKRRIGIAQALLGQPRLLIVDEPTVGLDPEERVRLRNLLAEIASERTVILSTHIIEDISQSCRALAVLDGGRVLFHGAPSALIDRARGRVWSLVTDGARPAGDVVVTSTLQLASGVQYRMLGEPDQTAAPVEPSLEDGYIWLMRSKNAADRMTSGA